MPSIGASRRRRRRPRTGSACRARPAASRPGPRRLRRGACRAPPRRASRPPADRRVDGWNSSEKREPRAPLAVERGVVDGSSRPAGGRRRPRRPRGPARDRRCRRASGARAKSIAAPRSIDRPAARSARPNPTASEQAPAVDLGAVGARAMAGVGHGVLPRRSAAARAGLAQVAAGAVAADLADVLLVLEDDAERLVDELGRQLAGTQRQQRRRPVERLGDPRAPWSGRPRAGDGRTRRPRARAAPAPPARGRGRSRTPSGPVG